MIDIEEARAVLEVSSGTPPKLRAKAEYLRVDRVG
jgi:hypothetical protein